jgi:hypothetical protein
MANYYDLRGPSTRLGWWPKGIGGPVREGGPSASTPVLEYSSGGTDAKVYGPDLTVSQSPAGTFITAIVKKPTPGLVGTGATSFSLLIPDVQQLEAGQSVSIHAVGILALHRGSGIHASGQLETYTEVSLAGTAATVTMRD